MPHFRLVKIDDILNGPVDYSAPMGGTATYHCSLSVDKALLRHRPAGKKFTATPWSNKMWYSKFCAHTKTDPEYVTYARGNSGKWYAQAVSF